MSDPVHTTLEGHVLTIELDRPRSLNALDPEMADGLDAALADAEARAAARCVVIRGAGGNFMAGGDIKHFHASLELPPRELRAHIESLIVSIHRSIARMRSMPKPVLASVEGACAGFGLSLMAACDLAIAAAGCTFSLAYVRLGTSPDGGSTWSLPRAVGMKRAMELGLLGDRFDADAAAAMGLVNRVVPADSLAAETAALAARLAAGPAAAMARTKALMGRSLGASLEDQLAGEREAFLAGVTGAEFAEGVRAFVGKRAPRFPTD